MMFMEERTRLTCEEGLYVWVYFPKQSSWDVFAEILEKRKEPWRDSWPELKCQQVEWLLLLLLLTSGKMRKIRVMPVKQWLEERRLLHGEMQKLKDKLAVSERIAKAESQLQERLKLRLKTIEDGSKGPNTFSIS
ncbi:hypothetical protein Bca101_015454 [Brassica carinata]